ncbi:C-GCAxxG-C-C family protein [Desulfosporosinus metallidurans]|uniref:C_GCAxxG_C_C family protein n=1 Tax=Desulfosporosinus metallidurans TaxID=1888891 RepID=A0A1Q8R1A3_9FIRM|nr:C-GCAxxG-C-C family protein [Desulfosporosinus metallidurans]OLN33200.1 hypothetical protein DSOL_0927 [Desulfosporosinus metallidurans]
MGYGSELSNCAEEFMKQGDNCCEAVVRAANKVWNLELAPEAIAVTSLFKEGMDSGCTCGALVGMVMISGILKNRYGHSLNDKLAADLTSRFRTKFGSTCCRVICKQRSLWEKISRQGCIALTAKTAGMLEEVWADVRNNADQNLRDHTHAQ